LEKENEEDELEDLFDDEDFFNAEEIEEEGEKVEEIVKGTAEANSLTDEEILKMKEQINF